MRKRKGCRELGQTDENHEAAFLGAARETIRWAQSFPPTCRGVIPIGLRFASAEARANAEFSAIISHERREKLSPQLVAMRRAAQKAWKDLDLISERCGRLATGFSRRWRDKDD